MASLEPLLLRGLELQRAGETAAATGLFGSILAADPGNFVALYSLALIHLNGGNPALALQLIDRALAGHAGYAPAHAVRANALQNLQRLPEAVAAYDAALALDPNYSEVLVNKGVLLHSLKRHYDALESFERVLQFQPNNAGALSNRGTLLTELNRNAEAAACFEQLLQAVPEFDYALGQLAFARLHCCDWTDHAELRERIEAGIRAGKKVCKTLPLFAISDSQALQLQAAELFARDRFPRAASAVWRGERYAHPRIRVAYLSPDFREHPVGHVSIGIFERHDRSRFETFGISLGIDDGGRLAKRFRENAFEHFVDARLQSPRAIAEWVRQQEIDILIDLAGFTQDSGTHVLAHRAAPVQVVWMGYAGTLGCDYVDYILADRWVVPPGNEIYFSEQVVRLRDSYLPADSALKVAERTPTRAECGLPDSGFVFCSFNHDFKIAPDVFAIWMRLLQQVPGSVLWLMKLNEAAQDNLRRAASAQGVDPARLVFATRVPNIEDHLARYRLADLFVDAYPYNAHSTAADALFVGLPVLTYMGRAFPGRVAGSLLNSLGVPELACDSLQQYEARALHLATHPEDLAALRRKVIEQGKVAALFDNERFVRSLETALTTMAERARRGEPAQSFDVGGVVRPVAPALRLQCGGNALQAGFQRLAHGPDGQAASGLLDLSALAESSVDEFYLCHVLQRLPQAAMLPALKGLLRALKPNGRLLIAVPDFAAVCRLAATPGIDKNHRFQLMRWLFGAQTEPQDFNLIGLDYDFLADYLALAGFARAERVRAFGWTDDASVAAHAGVPLSLNLVVQR